MVDVLLEETLRRVAEWRVADVVDQGRGADGAAVDAAGGGLQKAWLFGRQRVVDPAGEVHGAQHVAKTAVLGARKNQVRKPELMNRAQPLDGPRADQGLFEGIGVDKAVDRIAVRGRRHAGALSI